MPMSVNIIKLFVNLIYDIITLLKLCFKFEN